MTVHRWAETDVLYYNYEQQRMHRRMHAIQAELIVHWIWITEACTTRPYLLAAWRFAGNLTLDSVLVSLLYFAFSPIIRSLYTTVRKTHGLHGLIKREPIDWIIPVSTTLIQIGKSFNAEAYTPVVVSKLGYLVVSWPSTVASMQSSSCWTCLIYAFASFRVLMGGYLHFPKGTSLEMWGTKVPNGVNG